ncbi:hypothetical protein OAO01_00050 [Oligoflexia bacterium]|nr:hypothetical protein [Oligoflexia bacterium]
MVEQRGVYWCLLCLGSFLLLGSTVVFAADFNVDADGKSDLIIVKVLSDQTLNWSCQSSGSSFSDNLQLTVLGESGDHLIPAHWTTSDTAEVGIISLNQKQKVVWKIEQVTGKTKKITFGKKGDVLVSGGDYNGNGLSGAAKISATGEALIFADPFAGGSKSKISFDKKYVKKGKVLFFSRSGSHDDLGIAHSKRVAKKSYKTTLVAKDIYGAETEVRLKRLKNKIKEALPVAGADGIDNIAVVYSADKKLAVEVYNLSGKRLHRKLVARGSTIVVGNFLDKAGEEIGVYKKKKLTAYNPLGGKSSKFAALPNGIAADHINVNSFGKSSPTNTGGGGSGGGGSTTAPAPGSLTAACPNGIKAVSSGFLWKDDADHKLGPPRAGKPVLLFQNDKPGFSSVEIIASNGDPVCSAGHKAPSSGHEGVNCNSAHYYVGWSGGCGKSGGEIAKAAKAAAGKTSVYVKIKGGRCIGPINPDTRNGGINC